MNLPKPQQATSVDASAVFSKFAADQKDWDERTTQAQAKAAQAYARLLDIAQHSDTGQARRVAEFIAATYNGHAYSFDLFDLRAVDVAISDDMLTALDALRWGRADLYTLVPDGQARIRAMLELWEIQPGSSK